MISLPMQAGIANRGAKERSSELPMPHARKARFSGNALGTHAWPVRTWGKQTNLFYLPKAYLSPPFFTAPTIGTKKKDCSSVPSALFWVQGNSQER